MRFDGVADDLILALDVVHADSATRDDAHAVLRTELQNAGLSAKNDRANLRLIVLEREVNVPRTPGAAVGNFAFDSKAVKRRLEDGFDPGRQFADRQRARG